MFKYFTDRSPFWMNFLSQVVMFRLLFALKSFIQLKNALAGAWTEKAMALSAVIDTNEFCTECIWSLLRFWLHWKHWITNIFPFYIPLLAAFQPHIPPIMTSHKSEQCGGADHTCMRNRFLMRCLKGRRQLAYIKLFLYTDFASMSFTWWMATQAWIRSFLESTIQNWEIDR